MVFFSTMLLSFLFNFESLSNKNNSDDVAHIMSLSNDGCHYNVPGGETSELACHLPASLPPLEPLSLLPADHQRILRGTESKGPLSTRK